MSRNYPTIQDELLAGLERRKELIHSKCVPFEYEIIKSQGDCFADILMNQMSPNAIHLMHQDKVHQMPSANLWISPESRVNKKICITNASIYDKIKATSHKGILEIGENIEKKIEKKHLLQLKKNLNENSEFERFECEKRIQFALNAQQDYYKMKIQKLTEIFNEKFKYQKDMLQHHYQKKCNKIVQKIIADCTNAIQDAVAIEKNKHISCFCKKRKTRKIKKLKTENQFTSCTNLIPPEKPNYLQKNNTFNNKNLSNMMHFVLCGEKLENLKVMKNMKKNFATELNNIKINLFKIIENITIDINQPPLNLTNNNICSQSQSFKDVYRYSECFDILCCLRQKIKNIVMSLDNQIESLDVGQQKNNIINTCTVIVPKKCVKQVFCDCVSSSLENTITESSASSNNIFNCRPPDFISPNVNWNRDNINVDENSLDIICQCRKKIEISDSTSSSAQSFKCCLPVENKVVPAIKYDNSCSSTSSI